MCAIDRACRDLSGAILTFVEASSQRVLEEFFQVLLIISVDKGLIMNFLDDDLVESDK